MSLIAADSPRERAVHHASTAALSLLGLAAMMSLGGARWQFDLGAPEFSLLNLLLPLVGAAAVYHAAQTALTGLRAASRRAGIVEIAGDRALPQGAELHGRVRLARPLAAGAQVRLTLQCLDIYEVEQALRNATARPMHRAQLAWEGTYEIDALADPALLPFAIRLPATLEPVHELIEPDPRQRFRHAPVRLTGRLFKERHVVADQSARPVGRRWRLLVQAQPGRRGHHAEFELPIRVGN